MTALATRERLAGVENPGLVVGAFYGIGRRLFGQVPTPEKLMAHRPALMVGLGGLWSAIEWGGTIDAQLRALLNFHVAALYNAAY